MRITAAFAALGMLAISCGNTNFSQSYQIDPNYTPAVQAQPAPTTPAPFTQPTTVAGGSGNQCLAVDVLAHSGAFIRRGTAGRLQKANGRDIFVVNGVRHDITAINYSIKGC